MEQPGTGCRKQHNTLHIADLWLKPLLLFVFSAFTWAANILSMIFCCITSQLVLSGQAKPVAPWMVNVEQLQALLWINDSVSSCWASVPKETLVWLLTVSMIITSYCYLEEVVVVVGGSSAALLSIFQPASKDDTESIDSLKPAPFWSSPEWLDGCNMRAATTNRALL